ncbi:MAG: hypothetical protein KGJ06_06565 [Pseudomonadota bacterium]|nr:hypothetical protein [Pseudomonadota bacterium]
MTIEAFWSLSFHSSISGNTNAGFGVVIFESERIFGGDSSFYYNGNYKLINGDIRAAVRVKRYAPGLPSITGLDDYKLIVEKLGRGDYNGDQFMIEGHVDGVPSRKVYVGFNRIENLP